VTHVAISLEACEAFREGREWPMSHDMQTSLRFYEERCAKFGVPKGFGHPNGFSRMDTTLSYWSGRRPNWRFKRGPTENRQPRLLVHHAGADGGSAERVHGRLRVTVTRITRTVTVTRITESRTIRRDTTRDDAIRARRAPAFCYIETFLSRKIRRLGSSSWFATVEALPPRHTMPKREHPDDVPLMPYIWRSRHVDPRRQTWMQDGIWSEADLSTLLFFVSERNHNLQ
jgi:hypothetical protein